VVNLPSVSWSTTEVNLPSISRSTIVIGLGYLFVYNCGKFIFFLLIYSHEEVYPTKVVYNPTIPDLLHTTSAKASPVVPPLSLSTTEVSIPEV
jgi:hypothetical protein